MRNPYFYYLGNSVLDNNKAINLLFFKATAYRRPRSVEDLLGCPQRDTLHSGGKLLCVMYQNLSFSARISRKTDKESCS